MSYPQFELSWPPHPRDNIPPVTPTGQYPSCHSHRTISHWSLPPQRTKLMQSTSFIIAPRQEIASVQRLHSHEYLYCTYQICQYLHSGLLFPDEYLQFYAVRPQIDWNNYIQLVLTPRKSDVCVSNYLNLGAMMPSNPKPQQYILFNFLFIDILSVKIINSISSSKIH